MIHGENDQCSAAFQWNKIIYLIYYLLIINELFIYSSYGNVIH